MHIMIWKTQHETKQNETSLFLRKSGEMKGTKAPNGPIPGYNMLHYLNECVKSTRSIKPRQEYI